MKMEPIQCSETSAYKIQMPGNYPEDNILHPQHRESLKTTRVEEPYRCRLKGFLDTADKSYFPPLKFYGLIKMNLTEDGWGSCCALIRL
jgi:hypothetical protein